MANDGESPVPGMPKPNAQWGAVIDGIFKLEVRETYERLVGELSLDDGAWTMGSMMKAANLADQRGFEATRLVRAAKLEEDRVRDEVERQLGTMRESARSELNAEKLEGTRSKAPTLEEVADRVRKRWPDKSRRLSEELARMHGAVRACEGLEESWRSRSRTLQTMLKRRG